VDLQTKQKEVLDTSQSHNKIHHINPKEMEAVLQMVSSPKETHGTKKEKHHFPPTFYERLFGEEGHHES